MARRASKTTCLVVAVVLIVVTVIVFAPQLSNLLQGARVRLPVGKKTPAISLGERDGLILASDGSLWTWGSDILGWPVLGLGSNTLKSVCLRRIDHETNWSAISAGWTHNLAIRSDGTIWTWGESVRGRRTRLVAIYTPVPAAPGNDWKQAAAGGIISAAIKTDGTLWCWGDNWAGSVGISSTNGSTTPVRIGSATNWIKVWAGILETVGQQSDGSLWYWGENPDPSYAQGAGQIFSPTRVSADTNWADVGFGVNTVFAIKSDGTLWTWGRQADRYTGLNTNQDAFPERVGTDSDWRSFAATSGWWCSGLVKKDGSLWLMDASDGQPNGPRPPYPPVRFKPIQFPKPCAAFAAGAVHAAAPGVHGPIAVVLTPDGEVWTTGMVLGDPATLSYRLRAFAARVERWLIPSKPRDNPEPDPVYRNEPWQLRNIP